MAEWMFAKSNRSGEIRTLSPLRKENSGGSSLLLWTDFPVYLGHVDPTKVIIEKPKNLVNSLLLKERLLCLFQPKLRNSQVLSTNHDTLSQHISVRHLFYLSSFSPSYLTYS